VAFGQRVADSDSETNPATEIFLKQRLKFDRRHET